MADNPRIEDLRRRVQKDPASIAFAQLAEEFRRAGALQEAVDVCLAGLAIHPSYLSARVTLGRALLELDRLDQAQTELERVLASAPENLAASRGLGEIFSRRGAARRGARPLPRRARAGAERSRPRGKCDGAVPASRSRRSSSSIGRQTLLRSLAGPPVGNVPSRQPASAVIRDIISVGASRPGSRPRSADGRGARAGSTPFMSHAPSRALSARHQHDPRRARRALARRARRHLAAEHPLPDELHRQRGDRRAHGRTGCTSSPTSAT